MSIQCQFKICFGIPDLSTDTSSINEFQTLGMKSSVAKVQGLENQSLCQKLKSFIGYRFIDVYQIHLRIPDSSTDSGFPDLSCFDRFQFVDIRSISGFQIGGNFSQGQGIALYPDIACSVCIHSFTGQYTFPLQSSTQSHYMAVHSSFTGQYTFPLQGSTHFLYRVLHSSFTGQYTVPLQGSTQLLYRVVHSSYTGQCTVPITQGSTQFLYWVVHSSYTGLYTVSTQGSTQFL